MQHHTIAKLAVVIGLFGAADRTLSGQTGATGRVSTSTGQPIIGAKVLYTRQVSYALSAPGTNGHAARWVIAGPRVSGTVSTGINGAFTLPPLPDGNYGICVISPVPGYEDSCRFDPGILANISQGRAPALADLHLKSGREIHIRINDPSKLAVKTKSGPVPLIIGVLTVGTTFYAARLVSEDSIGRDYSITVPSGASVKLWLFSRTIKMADATGKVIDTNGYALLVPPNADTTRVDYVFSVVGSQP